MLYYPPIDLSLPYYAAHPFYMLPDVSEDDINAIGREVEKLIDFPPLSEKKDALTWAILMGKCPPFLISNYSELETWTEAMGLVLLTGFCPMGLAGVRSLLELNQRKKERRLRERLLEAADLTTNQKRLKDADMGLCRYLHRLDGLDAMMGGAWLNKGSRYTQYYRFQFYARECDCIAENHYNSQFYANQCGWIAGDVLLYFGTTCHDILPIWFASDLSNEKKLPPSEFVRWAINHKIHIPWLDLAKRHFPHLLPEEICRPKAVADAPTLPELKEDQQNQPPEPEDKGQHDSIPPETVTVQTSSRAKNDIFISYATDDRERLRPLVDALETAGWSVFWDRKVPAGERWRDHIPENLRASRYVIVAWSKNSISSDYVREEAEDAKNHGVLLPIYIDRVEPPFGFGELQTYDLIGWNGATDQQPFQNLVRRIAEILGQKLVTNSPIPSQKTKQRTEQLQPDKLDADDFASPSEQKTIIPHRELNE